MLSLLSLTSESPINCVHTLCYILVWSY